MPPCILCFRLESTPLKFCNETFLSDKHTPTVDTKHEAASETQNRFSKYSILRISFTEDMAMLFCKIYRFHPSATQLDSGKKYICTMTRNAALPHYISFSAFAQLCNAKSKMLQYPTI